MSHSNNPLVLYIILRGAFIQDIRPLLLEGRESSNSVQTNLSNLIETCMQWQIKMVVLTQQMKDQSHIADFQQMCYFDVGIVPFHAAKQPLEHHPPTPFAMMASKRFANEINNNSYMFVDRDTTWFRLMHNFSRGGAVPRPSSGPVCNALLP